MAKNNKCETCKKGSGFSGCSHIECPKRKPYTANYQFLTNAVDMANGHRRSSKKFLNEDNELL